MLLEKASFGRNAGDRFITDILRYLLNCFFLGGCFLFCGDFLVAFLATAFLVAFLTVFLVAATFLVTALATFGDRLFLVTVFLAILLAGAFFVAFFSCFQLRPFCTFLQSFLHFFFFLQQAWRNQIRY